MRYILSEIPACIKGLVLFIFLCTVLAACSNKYMYEHIDWLARIRMERYVDLTQSQSNLLKVNLVTLKERHRRNELSNYLLLLNEIKEDIQQTVDENIVNDWIERIESAYEQIIFMTADVLVEIAGTLSDEQIQEFFSAFDRRHQNYEKKYLSRDVEEYSETILERMEDQFSYWLGKLTPAQKERISHTSNQFERLDEAWLKGRLVWRDEIAHELTRQPGWETRLAAVLQNNNRLVGADADARMQRNQQRIIDTIVDVLNIRTQKQDAYLNKKLEKWQSDIIAMQNPA